MRKILPFFKLSKNETGRGRALIRGSILRIVNQFTQIIISFILTPVIVNSLGDRDYGLWGLVGSFVYYFGLMDLGLATATARFSARALAQHNVEAEKEYADTSLIIYIFISFGVILLGLFIMALGPMIIKNDEIIGLFRILVAITALNVAFFLPFRVFSGILKARLRYDLMTIISISLTIAKAMLVYIFLSHGFGVLSLAVISFFVIVVESWLIYRYSCRFFPFSWRNILFKRKRFDEIFSYSIYAFIGSVAQLLILRIDAIVITLFRSVERVTPYSIGSSIIRYGSDFTLAIIGTLEPVFSQEEGQGNFENVRRILLLTLKISVIISVATFSFLAIYGHDFIIRWIGKSYDGLHEVILWLCLANFAGSAPRPIISMLFGISKHVFYVWLSLLEGIANLIISIILIQYIDIIGVAIGSAIPAIILKLVVLPVYASRVIDISLKSLLVTFLVSSILPCTIFNFIYWLFVVDWVSPDYLNITILGGIQMILFFSFAWFFVFSPAERQYLMKHITNR